MNSTTRTSGALLLLLGCSTTVSLLCTLIGSGRGLAFELGLTLNTGTWLNASPIKTEALRLVAASLALMAAGYALWLLRAQSMGLRVGAAILGALGTLAPALLFGSTTNPALARLSDRMTVSTEAWPLWSQWSRPDGALRAGAAWPRLQLTVSQWVRAHESELSLPQWVSAPARRPLAYMHLVSQLWGPGNRVAYLREGCVRSNEDNNWQYTKPLGPDPTRYMQARIACCDDYAHMLAWLLRAEGYEVRLLAASGHIFVELKLGGDWQMLDAQNNAYIDAPFTQFNRGAPVRLLLGTHAAEQADSPNYRPRFALDRWRLLTTLALGGHATQVSTQLPATFSALPQ